MRKTKNRRELLLLLITGILLISGCGKVREASKGESAAAESYQETQNGAGTERTSDGQGSGAEVLNKLKDLIAEKNAVDYQEVQDTEFDGTLRYYYGQLDEERQVIYREIVQGIREHQEVITTHGDDPEKVNDIFTKVYMDYPEFVWIDGTVETTGYSGMQSYCEVCPVYTIDEEQARLRREEIEEAASEWLLGIDREGGTYEKIRSVFETIINRTDYVSGAPENQNMYSVLVNHQSVCAGYARTFQYLMNCLGIECIYVTGTITGGEAHAWNIVSCDGTYYNVDVTWGDPVFAEGEADGGYIPENLIYYDFLCCSDQELAASHTADQELVLPECTATDREYYRLQGRYYEWADRDGMVSRMKQDIDAYAESTELKCADANVRMDAEGYLTDILSEAGDYLCMTYGLEQTTYYYSVDQTANKILVYWSYE